MKTILVDAINTFIIKDEGINTELFNLLEQYPNQKVILTNADDDQFIKYKLHNMPYPVFTLKHNPNKDNPQYFTQLLTDYDLNANDCIYFDHKIEAVNSASSIGITSFHFDKDKISLNDLKEFIDSNL